MKRAIVSSKQLGEVYYMCGSLFNLEIILKSGEIAMSKTKEKSVSTGELEYFTSLTRNFKSLHAQKPSKWRDGVILDGTKLSETYSIDPINFAGYNMEHQVQPNSGKLKILQITRWPSRCMIKFVGGSTEFQISEAAYEDLKDACLNKLSDYWQTKCRMEVSSGKRKRNGEIFKERIKFNNLGGGPANLFQLLSNSTKSELLTAMDQHEERVHGPSTVKKGILPPSKFRSTQVDPLEVPVIHISNCVKGVVINSEDAAAYPELVEDILSILETQYGLSNPKIIEYT